MTSLHPPRRADARFMRAHPAHWIALGFGSGLAPKAPGTVGTLWAWLCWWALSLWLSESFLLALCLVSLPVGWWACERTARHLGQNDPGAIVIDEVVAFWAILWLLGDASWPWQWAGFVLFRAFDALKPGPVGWADRAFKGGGWRGAFGILFDDLVAALLTLIVLALAMRIWP